MSNETRKLPTRPGWWWVTDAVLVDDPPVLAEFQPLTNGYAVYIGDQTYFEGDLVFIAEVPPPEVCAAWDAAGRPSGAVLEALGSLIRAENSFAYAADSERVGYWVDDLITEIRDMKARTAIRAERDGAA